MAEKVKDLYAVLGVESDATEKEIIKAFRKLSKIHHPDISKEEDAAEKFKEIQIAYEELSDPEKRADYDAFVRMHKEGKNTSFAELYEKFTARQPGAHAPMRGDDVKMEVEFTVSEVRQQATKIIRFDRYVNCSDCEGHGFHRHPSNVCHDCKGKGYALEASRTPFGEIKTEKQCRTCMGRGYVNVDKCASCNGEGKKELPVEISFTMPKETTEGFQLKLKEKGDAGFNGGVNGDLFLTFTHSPDDPFELVNDYDVNMKLDVSFLKALTGGQVSVTTPRGAKVNVPIARGTQTGHRIIVPDEGLFNPMNGFYGNLTLQVNILVPNALPDDKVQKLINILG